MLVSSLRWLKIGVVDKAKRDLPVYKTNNPETGNLTA